MGKLIIRGERTPEELERILNKHQELGLTREQVKAVVKSLGNDEKNTPEESEEK